MKRITALVMALAMILTLAACGGKNTDQPNTNTPPVTQGETTNQPDSNPADNTQPSEPADTPTNEPQNNAGTLPEGGFYLYDGVHYLSAFSDGNNISSTVISGEKAENTVHEIFVELTESHTAATHGSMSIPLGQTAEPFNYQISFVDESDEEFSGIGKTVAPGGTNSFDLADSFGWVANSSDEEKTVADCPLVFFTSDVLRLRAATNGKITLDGHPVATLDDLINVLGTPTAVYCIGGPSELYFIWQSENFIYTAWIQADAEEKFDEARQAIYLDVNWNTAEVLSFSYYVPDSVVDATNTVNCEHWNTTWPVQVLTDLGLL